MEHPRSRLVNLVPWLVIDCRMPLNIPESDILPIEQLAQLSFEAADQLRVALEKQPPAMHAAELSKRVASLAPLVPTDTLEQIVRTVVTLSMVRNGLELDPGEFAQELSKSPNLTLAGEERARLELVVRGLLHLSSVQVTSKALDILTEHQLLFHGARVISEIRPVYAEDISQKPAAAVIVHMLKIAYHESTDHKEIFVGLDSDDLLALKRAIERAEAKQMSLEAILRSADIPYVGPDHA